MPAPDSEAFRPSWPVAISYFAACWAIAIGVGLLIDPGPLEVALTLPTGTAETVWGFVLAAIAIVGYWVVWPMGTRHHGRQLHVPWVLVFGLVWGLSESLLMITVWAVAAEALDRPWAVVAVSFLALSAFIGLWHQFVWDVLVAPDHNIAEWNLRKVLLVHTPFLLAIVGYLSEFEVGVPVVVAGLIALVGSSWFMRMPSPWT